MRRTLKKTVAVGLAAATAFSLCACGGSGDGSKSGSKDALEVVIWDNNQQKRRDRRCGGWRVCTDRITFVFNILGICQLLPSVHVSILGCQGSRGNEQGIWSGDHMCGNIWNSICGGDCGCTGVDTWNIYR